MLAVAFLLHAVGVHDTVIVKLTMETAIVAVIAMSLVTVVQMLPALEVSILHHARIITPRDLLL